jgi:organic radical activating enzyme
MPPRLSANKLAINEIFYSIQGEGKYVGIAAVFVRFAGCNANCKWCDSKYARKTNFQLTPKQIFTRVKKYPAKDIVITGGEPTRQNLHPLFKLLKKNNFRIHLETNGSNDIDTSLLFCTTVSPKKNALAQMLDKADVIKIIVDDKISQKQILIYKKFASKASLYLQPEGNKQENIKKCLKLIKRNPRLRLSLQTHKLIDIK